MKTWKPELWIQIIINCLIILWVYTACSKLIAFGEFSRQMALQPFGRIFNQLLVYFLPAIEFLVAVLLVMRKTRLIGLFVSCLLMFAFTFYISLVLTGYYTKMPCSCGGVIESLSWKDHLLFNLFFLLINLVAFYLLLNQSKKGGQAKT
jgi:putative oxidoreductase